MSYGHDWVKLAVVLIFTLGERGSHASLIFTWLAHLFVIATAVIRCSQYSFSQREQPHERQSSPCLYVILFIYCVRAIPTCTCMTEYFVNLLLCLEISLVSVVLIADHSIKLEECSFNELDDISVFVIALYLYQYHDWTIICNNNNNMILLFQVIDYPHTQTHTHTCIPSQVSRTYHRICSSVAPSPTSTSAPTLCSGDSNTQVMWLNLCPPYRQ